MNKTYFIAPLLPLAAFIALYASHASGMKERETARLADARAASEAKAATEREARRLAMADAIQAAERRKAEKEAAEAREKIEREERQTALDARDLAFRDQEKSARQIERLRKEVEAEEAALARLDAQKKSAFSEKKFLDDYVTRARANVTRLEAVIARLPAIAAPNSEAARS